MSYYVDQNGIAKKVLSVVEVKEVEVDYYVGVATIENEKKDRFIVPQSLQVGSNVFPILDNTKSALVELGGNSIAFNQLAQNGNFALNSGWFAISSIYNFSILNNKATATKTAEGSNLFCYKSNNDVKLTLNHKYLVIATLKPSDACKVAFRVSIGGSIKTLNANEDNLIYDFISATQLSGIYLGIEEKEGLLPINGTIEISNVMLFDLTLMGLENITIAEFEALFASDYYEYNEGEVKSTILSKIESFGANLSDKSSFSQYNYSSDYAKFNPNNAIALKKGTYAFSFESTNGDFYMQFFNSENSNDYLLVNEALESGSPSYGLWWSNRALTLNDNTKRFFIFTLKRDCIITICGKSTEITNCMINIGETTQPYVPYVGKIGQITLPNAPITLNGVNDIHDLLTFEEQQDGTYNAILTRKIGVVDLGSLNWTYDTSFSASLSHTTKGTGNYSNLLCAKYFTRKNGSSFASDKCIYSANANYIRIEDSSYTDATTFKSSLNGVYLYYELTTPTTETIATGLTFDQVSTLFEKGGTIVVENSNTDYIKTNLTMAFAVRRFRTTEE